MFLHSVYVYRVLATDLWVCGREEVAVVLYSLQGQCHISLCALRKDATPTTTALKAEVGVAAIYLRLLPHQLVVASPAGPAIVLLCVWQRTGFIM